MNNIEINDRRGAILQPVMGCFYFLFAVSGFLVMYRTSLVVHSTSTPIIYGSSLTPIEQWCWFAENALGNLIVGVGVLRGWARIKVFLIALTTFNTVVFFVTIALPLPATLGGAAISYVPVLVVMMSRLDPRKRDRERLRIIRVLRFVVARAVFAFAAFIMYVMLTLLFFGQKPAHSTANQTGVEMYIWLAMSFMLLGGAVMGRMTIAVREVGIILVSVASFIVFFCTSSYLILALDFRKASWHFFWDETLPWVLILGIGGFLLLGLSESRRSN